MPDANDSVEWARGHADELRALPDQDAYSEGPVATALEFLRTQAGPKSEFYARAIEINGRWRSRVAAWRIGGILDEWARWQESGLSSEVPAALRTRTEAATDLMEQVQILLDDPKVHPAAPVMLAGAALEEFLRGLVLASGVTVKGKEGLNSYAASLRAADVIDAQDVKDITAIAGARNDAAHGDFERINRERADIMVAHVNLFLRQKSKPVS